MKPALLALAAACLMSLGPQGLAAMPTHPSLRDELLQMKVSDQQGRKATTQEEFRKWVEIDATNQKRLKQIVEQHGWPTVAMVGEDGASAAWLLVQHADSDRGFQRRVLHMMEGLVKEKQVTAKDYAYLYDRTTYPQRYGTQGSCISREEWQPFLIEDIENVDARRREAGLPPLAEYAALFRDMCAQPHAFIHPADDPRRTVAVPKR